MMRATVSLAFDLGDHVCIDGLTDKIGVVTSVTWRSADIQYEVCWWNERQHQSGWFSDWRLSLADTTPKVCGFTPVSDGEPQR
jgi:hypothetical protein